MINPQFTGLTWRGTIQNFIETGAKQTILETRDWFTDHKGRVVTTLRSSKPVAYLYREKGELDWLFPPQKQSKKLLKKQPSHH